MTVNEVKVRIENELEAIKESFGDASSFVKYSVEIGENNIDDIDAPVDITSVFGSFSIGPMDSSEDGRLYLPLDVELDDDDNVNEENFEKNLEGFKESISKIRERVLAAEDYDAEIKAIIREFDAKMEEEYKAELERLNRLAKRNLIAASLAVVAVGIIAIVILVAQKLM